MTERLVERFDEAVPDDADIVIALGGGADSASLLAIAVMARGNDSVRAVIVDHGLPSSHLLRASAERLSQLVDVRLTVLDARVEDGPNLEARARDRRYRAIESHLDEGEICCTAHTSDDQAETVLMRLMHGAGSDGLAGIPTQRDRFYRPLLDVSRDALRGFAEDRSLPFTDDPSNEDPRHLRNRLRHDLIPLIESDYAPGFRDNLVRSAAFVADDADVVEQQADGVPVVQQHGRVEIPVAVLLTVADPVATRVIRRALFSLTPLYRGGYEDVVQAFDVLSDGRRRSVSYDVECSLDGPMLVFARKSDREPPVPTTVGVGDSFAWGGESYRVRGADRPSDLLLSDLRTPMRAHRRDQFEIGGIPDGATIDIGVGSTPVRELLRVHGVPADRRRFWMAIAISGRIAAVRGVRIAAWARPTDVGSTVVIEREGRT